MLAEGERPIVGFVCDARASLAVLTRLQLAPVLQRSRGMETTPASASRIRPPASSGRGRAAVALAALVAVFLGCDPVVRPGDSSGDNQNNQQTSGDIFDSVPGGTGGGGAPRDCGGGPYTFSISASDVDPWVQTGEVSGQGATRLWLWKTGGGGLGAVAGDLVIDAPTDGTTFAVFNATPPSLNIDRDDLPEVFLAVAGCPSGAALLGEITVYGRPETLRVRLASLAPKSVAVDCCGNKPGWPIVCGWFEAALPDTAGSDTTRVAAGR
jgi:hypothetical protein